MTITLLFCMLTMQAFASSSINEVSNTDSIVLNGIEVTNLSQGNLRALEEKYGLTDFQNNTKETNVLSLQYNLGKAEQGFVDCTASGVIKINNITQQFSAQGQLYTYQTASGDVIYSGGLVGLFDGATIFESDKIVTISLNYNETTKQAYIPVTIGSFGNDSCLPVMVEFGEYFNEIKQAIDNMVTALEKNSSATSLNNQNSININAPSANVTEYCLATAKGTYNRKDVIFHSYYGTKEAVPSGSFLAKVRTQVHLKNFISAYNSSLPPYNPNNPTLVYDSINHCVTDVWLNFTTNKTNNRIIDPLPAAFSSSIILKSPTFKIPYGALNYAMSYINLKIPLNGISHAYNSTYNTLQTKIWKGTNISQAITTTTNPYTTKTGVANNFLVFNSMNAGTSCTATTNGSARIFFEDIRVNGDIVPRWVVVSSVSEASTLKSVK